MNNNIFKLISNDFSKCFSFFLNFRFSDTGLKKAKQATAALYDGDFASLSSLSQAEMKSIFFGAKIHEVLFEPGMTVLDLVLKSKIYKHDRKHSISFYLIRFAYLRFEFKFQFNKFAEDCLKSKIE